MYNKIYYMLIGVTFFSAQAFAQDKVTAPLSNLLKAPAVVLIVAGVLLFLWVALVIGYLVWSVHRYNINLGLSNHEWKILYPEAYANPKELNKYLKVKEDLIADAQRKQDMQQPEVCGENRVDITAPFMEPDQNPYERDSFGLPPNTIRGLIALTALFMFVLVEGVNFFSTSRVETDFTDLVYILEMVIAFYFGSRAVEAFKEKIKVKEEEPVIKEKPVLPAQVPSVSPPVKPVAKETTEEDKFEKPLLPEEKNLQRIISYNENLSLMQPLTEAPVTNDIRTKPLPQRILALTGSFETSQSFPKCFAGITGNFDGQGISFGVLQWNFGQRTLPPLLQKMNTLHNDVCRNVLGSLYFDFERMLTLSAGEQLAWSKSIQFTENKNGKTRWSIHPDWSKAFIDLAMTSEMIALQAESSGIAYHKALGLCNEYELSTERGAALMFDIVTQNGTVDKNGSGRRIKEEYMKIPPGLDQNQLQTEKMIIIANKRAEVANPAFIEDVRNRKLAIAKGEGKVHSKIYNLERDFNITLKPVINA